MLKNDDNRSVKINQVVASVKLISILFCSIIVFSVFGKYSVKGVFSNVKSSNDSVFLTAIGVICVSIFILGYLIWINSAKNNLSNKKPSFRHKAELIMFMVAFMLLIALSGLHKSPYKSMFLFIITTSTIQFGMTYGIRVASVSSAYILALSLFLEPFNVINKYFEADLILAGVFLLTAWLLGYYSKIEESHREMLVDIANMDELTGLYNHRFFQQSLEQQVENSKFTGKSFSLLLIDIDNFKSYNDLYGHLEGDKILKTIASILKTKFRNNDIIARYGGEEFAVILPEIEEPQALVIAERVRSIVEKTEFNIDDSYTLTDVTVSIGLSCFPEKAKTKMELISGADDALYRAKFLNKNRVETYYSILEELKTYINEEHIDLITSIKTLISVINAKDHYTYAHTERVVSYCKILGEKLNLSEADAKTLKYGAYLHDIGKIEISKEVLNKYTPLNQEEWNIIKQHPTNGVEIIKPVDSLINVIPLIQYHHERYDGKGYPDQLEGENIPYLARVLTVVDSFDAMTSNRPYKQKKNIEHAIAELRNNCLTQFDPEIVEAFIEILDEKKIK